MNYKKKYLKYKLKYLNMKKLLGGYNSSDEDEDLERKYECECANILIDEITQIEASPGRGLENLKSLLLDGYPTYVADRDGKTPIYYAKMEEIKTLLTLWNKSYKRQQLAKKTKDWRAITMPEEWTGDLNDYPDSIQKRILEISNTLIKKLKEGEVSDGKFMKGPLKTINVDGFVREVIESIVSDDLKSVYGK